MYRKKKILLTNELRSLEPFSKLLFPKALLLFLRVEGKRRGRRWEKNSRDSLKNPLKSGLSLEKLNFIIFTFSSVKYIISIKIASLKCDTTFLLSKAGGEKRAEGGLLQT